MIYEVTVGEVVYSISMGDVVYTVTVGSDVYAVTLDGGSGDGIHDAPVDGVLYSRFNGAWKSVKDWLAGLTPEKVLGIQFDLNPTITHAEGLLHWDDDSGTLELGMPGGNVILQIGQEMHYRVTNKTGSLIPNGSAVYTNGAIGGRATIALSSADSTTGLGVVIGLTTEDIADNASGYMTITGIVRDLDTSAWSAGVPLWLSTTPGELTNIPPSAPDHRVVVGGVLVSSATEGKIYIQSVSAKKMSSLSDVNGTTPDATNKHLVWDNLNKYWDANQIAHGDLLDIGTSTHAEIDDILFADNEPTGFPNRTDSDMSFDDLTRTFTIEPAVTSFDFWVKGVKFIKTSAQTVVITDTEGLWFFLFHDDGTLEATQIFGIDVMADHALCAVGYWDSSNNEMIYLGEERHGIVMDGQTHAYLHLTRGTQTESGLGLDTNPDESGADDAHAHVGSASGIIWDEDIDISIIGTPIASAASWHVLYKDGAAGDWRSEYAQEFPVVTFGFDTTHRLAYNEWTGSAWQQTEVGNGNFVLCHIFATNDRSNHYLAFQGENEYSTKTAARLGAQQEITDLLYDGLPMAEFVAVGTVIFETKSTFSNLPKARVVSTLDGEDYVSWVDVPLSPTSGPGNHDNLLNIGTYSHSEIDSHINDADIHMDWVAAPSSATSTGVARQMAYDSSYLYICTATDTWTRIALAW